MSANVVQVFEYLLALKNMTAPVVKNFQDDKEQYWWQQELPQGDGCLLAPATKKTEAWLEVYKQTLMPAPTVPKVLQEWIKVRGHRPEQIPEIHNILIKNTDAEQIEVPFTADHERVAVWEKWLTEEWKPWSIEMLPRRKIQKLYGELFAIYQRLQREGDSTELVWGHGLLAWNVNDSQIYRPIFTTRMELLFDAKQGVFTLVPTSIGTMIELDMLSNAPVHSPAQLLYVERAMQEVTLNQWDHDAVRTFFIELAQVLSLEGSFVSQLTSGCDIVLGAEPVIYNAPLLFVRSMSGRQWHSELQEIIEAIRNGHNVPETIEALVSVNVAQNRDEGREREKIEWEAIHKEVLFPLPANAEQKDIIYKLSKNIGVVVQGPPGTGKSHTIVNLIAHLLAHGKRVLVTSQTERALQVLGEMIRTRLPEIAPLCVSVMGGDARSVQELESAVTKISEGLDQANVDILAIEIARLRQDLDDCRKKMASLKEELGLANEAENVNVHFAEQDFTPLELADWLANHQEEYGWMPDELNDSIALPLSDVELMTLYRLLKELSKEEVDQVLQHRPIVDNLPSVEEIVSVGTRLSELRERKLACEQQIKGWVFSSKANVRAYQALRVIDKATAGLAGFSEQWLLAVLDDVVCDENRVNHWQRLIIDCKTKIRGIREIAHRLMEFSVEIPAQLDLSQAKIDAEILKSELIKNGTFGMMFKMFSGKNKLYLLEKILINGSRLQTADDLMIFIHYITLLESKIRLQSQWNQNIASVNGPLLNEIDDRMLQTLEKYMEQIQLTFNWKNENIPELVGMVEDINPCGTHQWAKKAWLDGLAEGIIAHAQLFEYNLLEQEFEINTSFLKRGLVAENAHASWKELYEAYRLGDGDKWQDIVLNLVKIHFLESKVYQLLALKKQLNACAPRFMAQIEATVHLGNSPPASNWRKAWEWRRADSWLKKHFIKIRLEKLYDQLQRARNEETRLIQTLVAKSTWLEQNERTTELQKRSLRTWMQTIRKIGKGTGKYAGKHQADAKREMAICRSAVPVWIMPMHRMIENFKPSDAPFDVVIVDESSQSDLFALSALFRGKRAIIVGDDRQISPEAVGKDQMEVHNLIQRYLSNVPQRERFTLQDSLYDTALRVFPGQQILLKEHFRCVPEIIQFSNEQFYGGSIEPLRVPTSDRLTPPIVTVYVADGKRTEGSANINQPEAALLVAKIVELCNKKEYENKTMGIISLQGKEQAYVIEQQLREKIGEDEMTQRKILCGDAYSFQGDERDIIFLSMVAAPNMRSGVLNKITDEQRFNVATSRAKEQLWLFHSAELADLQEDCMRYRLLHYCQSPSSDQTIRLAAREIFERYGSSQFQQDVYQMIALRGYRILTECKVGTHSYRIPIVVEGKNARLAVECDGDAWHGLERWEEELERQSVLERVGWIFWRVRGSSFYRDRETTLASLWTTLAALGIEPQHK